MNKSARNERIKLLANWLNGSAIAAMAVGCFAPITGFVSSATPVTPQGLVVLVAGWFAASIVLHMIARSVLRRIEE